ncbi:MAG: T9SS type A sorting domain-containing protein [Bacteroidetes bacterium]|nr:T9SS type A sorting domain-containing protein [Bacteroidota bacterium]
MKKVFLVFCFVFSLSAMFRAQVYFNNRYGLPGDYTGGSQIVFSQNAYFVAGSACAQANCAEAALFKIDISGNLIWEKKLTQDHYSNANTVTALSDGNFMVCGKDSLPGIFLWKVDANGNTLWTNSIYDSTFHRTALMCKEADDHGLVIVGWGGSPTGNSKIILLKTDAAGNLLWEKRTTPPYYGYGTSLDKCIDGGFIIGGTWVVPNCSGPPFSYAYLQKTDSVGNMQWQHLYNINSTTGGARGADVIAVKEKFIFSATAFGDNYCQIGAICVLKTDSVGNIIWQTPLTQTAPGTYAGNLCLLSNGAYVVSGTAPHTSFSVHMDGVLIKVNDNGMEQWCGHYENIFGPGSSNYLYDVVVAPDGGYAAGGMVMPAAPDTGINDMWVMKTDGNGCDAFGNCPSPIVSGVPVNIQNENDFSVFPDPSDGIFTVHSDFDNYDLGIFDVNGKLILEKNSAEKKSEIDLTDQPAGIYFLKITGERGQIMTKKIIKN